MNGSAAPVRLDREGTTASLVLNRPGRHNSLVPELLEALLEAIDTVAADESLTAVVLAAEGRSFSTGGDVAAFAAQSDEEIGLYAERLVGLLNEAILGLFRLPVPLVGRLHGPVTGGSLGLVLACDLVVASPDAFMAPYYVEVGFSPDGGWSAILPERIGERRAREIQLLNRHVAASEMRELGLVDDIVEAERLEARIGEWLDTLAGKDRGSIRLTKRRLLEVDRLARYRMGLEEERRLFVERIRQPEARAAMGAFLERLGGSGG
ncbi:MAG: enoyl-CoA hydratase-related protein [Gammaproteobacteria bacterium]